MIAGRRLLLLETRLVFLVNNHKSQAFKRKKNGTARAQDNVVRHIRKLFFPNFNAFGVAVFRVVNAQTTAENLFQSAHHLYGQGDFGQQIEHLSTPIELLLNEMHIDFGLAARRNTVQQHDVLRRKLRTDSRESLGLRLAQRLYLLGLCLLGSVQSSHFSLVKAEHFAVDERLDDRRRAVRGVHQLLACEFSQWFLRRISRQ